MGAAGASIRTWPLLEINIERESGRSDSKKRVRLEVKEWLLGIPYFCGAQSSQPEQCCGLRPWHHLVGKSLAVSSRR